MTLIIDSGFNYDPDASAYIDAVEAADQADTPGIGAMETTTRYAINDFVIGCKQDGIWSAIKVGCILAGAKTLEGSFIDLKSGTKLLTNNGPFADGTYVGSNYTTGDYNRKTGLVGNGSTKYLDSNRNNNADPQNSKHLALYPSSLGSSNTALIGSAYNVGSSTTFRSNVTGQTFFRANNQTAITETTPLIANYVVGVSRANSGSINIRYNQATVSRASTSEVPTSGTILVFNETGASYHSNARLAFYSIGESLDLALLDARVTALINAFAAAIP